MKKLLLIVALAAPAFGLSVAHAKPGQEVTHTYYDGPDFKNVVSEEVVMTCEGRPSRPNIQRTRWYVVDSDPCENTVEGGNQSCLSCNPSLDGEPDCEYVECPPGLL